MSLRGKKYGDLTHRRADVSMHRELTRRQMEEHPPDGPDPENPLERKGAVGPGRLPTFASASPTCFG